MNPTVIRLAFSSLLGRSRSLGLLALPLVLLAVCLLARLAGGEPQSTDGTLGRAVMSGLGLAVVVPMLALLVAAQLLGNEMDDGTIACLLSKPIPRWHIVVSKLITAITATLLLGAVPMMLASLVLDHTDLGKALGWGVGAAVASVAYSALFLALSSMTKHSVVWGLMYLLVWEGALATLLEGISWLSIRSWSTRIAGWAGDMSVISVDSAPLGYAWIASGVVLVAGTAWAAYRLRGLSITGDD